jgi:hypothetical protein
MRDRGVICRRHIRSPGGVEFVLTVHCIAPAAEFRLDVAK